MELEPHQEWKTPTSQLSVWLCGLGWALTWAAGLSSSSSHATPCPQLSSAGTTVRDRLVLGLELRAPGKDRSSMRRGRWERNKRGELRQEWENSGWTGAAGKAAAVSLAPWVVLTDSPPACEPLDFSAEVSSAP